MRRLWILAAVLIIAVSISACGNKAPVEEPKQETQEPAKPEEEAPNPDQQANAGTEEEEAPAESPKEQEGAFRIPDFTSEDFEGNEVTNKFFADNKLTVVNIWTTT